MDTKETEAVCQQLTGGIFFAQGRNITRGVIERVVRKIAPVLKKNDADNLFSLEICAPDRTSFYETLPAGTTPMVWLSPEIEQVNDQEAAENIVATGLARALLVWQGIGRAQLDQRTKELVNTWGYVPTPHATDHASRHTTERAIGA